MTQQQYSDFVNLHIKNDLTGLVKELLANGYKKELSKVLSSTDFEQLELDIASTIDFTIYNLEDNTYLIFRGKGNNTKYFGRTSSYENALLELADIANIDTSSYTYTANKWYSVSNELYDYLKEHDELVTEWKGLLIWGTHTINPIHQNYTIRQAFKHLS